MKKAKLLLTTAITVFWVTVCCQMSAFALTDGDWEFQLLNNEAKITGYIGTDTDVVIPSTVYGVPVTKVEISWNGNHFRNVESLEYPGTVKKIKNNEVGKNLKKITLHEGTEIIGDYAFDGTSISSINLPSTVKEIGEHAFQNCTSLSQINLHNGVKKIGEFSFYKTGFTEVDLTELPEDCVYGDAIFKDCKYLKTAKLNKGMTEIPVSFFYECVSLTDVEIPSNVNTIGNKAFDECKALERIILPTSLKSIGAYAFNECESLKEVVIPYGVEKLFFHCFADCPALKSLYIPDTVSYIDADSLYGSIIRNSNNCIIYCSAGSYAEKVCKENELSYLTDNSVNSGITVLYNGTRISFHSYGQNPELLNSRTLVPLRSIFEAMGADVEWDGTTSTAIAKRGNIEVKVTIGANEIDKNGEKISVDVPAQLINGRTLVPARVIAEAFGADVQWNGDGKTVLITE